MTESQTSELQFDPVMVSLVAQTVKGIAVHKGYQSYPKESDIRMVLSALLLVQDAIKIWEERNGCTGTSTVGSATVPG
jgi:hypothetical protein